VGYYSSLTGSLDFTPEISAEIVSTLTEDKYDNLTWAGVFSASGYTAVADDTTKLYYVEEELINLITELATHDVTIAGTLIREGEETSDVERFIVVDNAIRIETVKLVWPDGTEYRR
jgi:hypothetical protein